MLLALALACAMHPVYRLQALPSPVTVEREGGAFRASASLRFRAVPLKRVMHSSDPGFNDHVRGHTIIAQQVARSSNGTTQAVGRTAAEARMHLLHALAQMTDDAKKELDREERVYDSVTEDGAAQDQGPLYHLPGGENTRERCPKP